MSGERPVKLRPKKKHPYSVCWVPGCNEKGDWNTLSDGETGEFDCVLCEKHAEEAAGAGQ